MAGYLGNDYSGLDSGYGQGFQPTQAGPGVAQGAAAGAAAGGPWGALIGAGGSFLSQYLAARAAEEENRKKALLEAAKTEGEGQSKAMSNMGNWYSQALLGG